MFATLFSLMNLIPHVYNYFFCHQYLALASQPLRFSLTAYTISACINWIASAIFHTRDRWVIKLLASMSPSYLLSWLCCLTTTSPSLPFWWDCPHAWCGYFESRLLHVLLFWKPLVVILCFLLISVSPGCVGFIPVSHCYLHFISNLSERREIWFLYVLLVPFLSSSFMYDTLTSHELVTVVNMVASVTVAGVQCLLWILWATSLLLWSKNRRFRIGLNKRIIGVLPCVHPPLLSGNGVTCGNAFA